MTEKEITEHLKQAEFIQRFTFGIGVINLIVILTFALLMLKATTVQL